MCMATPYLLAAHSTCVGVQLSAACGASLVRHTTGLPTHHCPACMCDLVAEQHMTGAAIARPTHQPSHRNRMHVKLAGHVCVCASVPVVTPAAQSVRARTAPAAHQTAAAAAIASLNSQHAARTVWQRAPPAQQRLRRARVVCASRHTHSRRAQRELQRMCCATTMCVCVRARV